MKRHRLRNVLVGIGVLAACGWWLAHVPYHPERLLYPIPAEAVFVSTHAEAAERWDALCQNRVTRGLLGLAMGGEAELDELSADPDFRTNLNRFGSHEFVAGFVREVGPARADAWYFTSWLGGRSHWLRWILSFSSGDMERHELGGGRLYWVADTDLVDARGREMKFALLFEEGIGIGCLSADSHNIQLAVACHDRLHRSVLDRDEGLSEWVLGSVGKDRGWVATRGVGQELLPLRYAITSVEEDRVTATARSEGATRTLAVSGAGTAVLPPVIGSSSYATAAATGDLSMSLIRAFADERWGREAIGLVEDVGGESLALGLFGGEYGGRLKGIRVPAVVAAVSCADEALALVAMNRLVHRVGIREGLGLSTMEVRGTEPTMYTITAPGDSVYGSLAGAEQAAFAAVDGWLLAATSRQTLERVLEGRGWAETEGNGENPGPLWMELDLDRGGKSIRNAIAAYSLVRMIEGAGDEVAQLNEVRGWIERLSGLGTLSVTTKMEEQAMVMDVEVGP